MGTLLEKLRAAAPQTRDQRDRRRRVTLKDRHQEPIASGGSISETNEISERDAGLLSANIVDSHATDETRRTGNVGGNPVSPTLSPSPIFDVDTIRKVSHRCLSLFLQNINIAKSLNNPETNERTHRTLQDELRGSSYGHRILAGSPTCMPH